MQSDNRFFDEFARMTSGMAGLAASMRQEVEQMVRARMQSLLADMDLVTKEEFDAVRAMAEKARAEQEKLEARVAKLEAHLDKFDHNAGGRAADMISPNF